MIHYSHSTGAWKDWYPLPVASTWAARGRTELQKMMHHHHHRHRRNLSRWGFNLFHNMTKYSTYLILLFNDFFCSSNLMGERWGARIKLNSCDNVSKSLSRQRNTNSHAKCSTNSAISAPLWSSTSPKRIGAKPFFSLARISKNRKPNAASPTRSCTCRTRNTSRWMTVLRNRRLPSV